MKKSLHVGERCSIEIGEIAVKIVGVRPIAESDRREVEPGKPAVGLIHHVHADFFLHHIALVAQIFVVHLQRAHAIRFEPQHAFQGVRGNGFEIIGDVVIGGAVQHASRGINQPDVFHLAGVFGALEHHMLEKMREAAPSTGLQAKSDLIINADGDDWRGAVRRNHHAEAIDERGVFNWDVQVLHFEFLLEFLKARSSFFRVAAGFFASTRAERRRSAA